jgi:hypothetical protein
VIKSNGLFLFSETFGASVCEGVRSWLCEVCADGSAREKNKRGNNLTSGRRYTGRHAHRIARLLSILARLVDWISSVTVRYITVNEIRKLTS